MSNDEYGDNNGCFRGYIYLPRTVMFLIRDQKMDFAIFGFYIALVSMADWDSRRKTFGFVKQNGVEISKILNITQSQFSRYKEKLFNFGFVKQTGKGLQLLEYKRFTKEVVQYLSKQNIHDRKCEIAELQTIIALSQEEIARLQKNKADIASPFKSSFNESNFKEITSEEIDNYFNSLQN